MGKSLLLAIDELAQSQSSAFQTVNDAVAAMEQSVNKIFSIVDDVDHDVTVSELNFIRSGVFMIAAGVTTVRFPATVNSLSTQRAIDVYNGSGALCTIRTTGAGTTTTIANGASKRLAIYDVDVIVLSAS